MEVLLLVVAFAAVALTSGPLLSSVRRVNERHALAGLFGEPERDRVVSLRATALIHDAERSVRLGRFRDRLSQHAWNGSVLRVRRVPGGATIWSFGDGSVWRVRQDSPAQLRRCIVEEAVETPAGMGVRVYVPCSYSEAVLHVQDAQEMALTPESSTFALRRRASDGVMPVMRPLRGPRPTRLSFQG
ncbi:MAG: hypothetical protein ACRD0N_08445 [Acidimicrobiales bacterium]